MIRVICILIFSLLAGSLVAQDWDANDDTFDPKLKSVVIGERSWIGDPSPFVFTEQSRTGYTHVNATQFEGFPPSVQISLMVPLAAGEKTPPAGGMLMLDKEQTTEMVKVLSEALKAGKKVDSKRVKLKTALKDADWTLVSSSEKDQRFIQLEFKSKDKVDKYRFSINASKKLLGAIQHSLKSLDKKTKK